MDNLSNKILNKRLIDLEFEKIKNVKLDPNNIFLNAAAFQAEIIKNLGINKKTIVNKKKKIVEKNIPISYYLPKLMKNNLKVEDEVKILNRKKIFLDNLSLAQKIGLVKINSIPFNEKEWNEIEKKTNLREDYKSTCPICLDILSKRQTLLLSCSHIFHKVMKILRKV